MKMSRHKRKYIILLCIGLIGIFLAIWTIWSNKALMVSEISISSDHLPSSFSGYRIAHISDLHNTQFGEENATLLQMLSECQPDIIVITGDLIDAQHTDVEVAICFAQKAVQIAPTYYVTGNHEASSSQYDTLKTELKDTGVTLLEDEIVYLEQDGEVIALLGIDDPNFTIKGDLFDEVPAMVNTKLKSMLEYDTVYSVLLSHRPELFETYVACGVDLVLSGHAHGGQFRIPFLGGLVAPGQGIFPEYDSGVFTSGNTKMVVSRGIGNSIIPVRVFNRPELVIIDVQ